MGYYVDVPKGDIIDINNHKDIYDWLCTCVQGYEESKSYRLGFTLHENRINVDDSIYLNKKMSEFKYPFGVIGTCFSCKGCVDLKSLIGSPKIVGTWFSCAGCHSLMSLIGCPEYTPRDFNCSGCDSLTSLIGAPKEVGETFEFYNCDKLTSLIGFPKHIGGNIRFHYNKFSNNPLEKEKYKLYLAMWLELLESVNNEERLEYINSYKYKTNIYNQNPIIPVEIMMEYGF